MAMDPPGQQPTSVIVVSGGSACNEILDSFTGLFETCRFVLPVSDNGGSSSEIIRVLGGPSLGDIRSRLVRLIPNTPDKAGIKALFAYRLPNIEDGMRVKQEWLEIVEGSHHLWRNIPTDRREAIRAFFVHFEHAILRRAQRRFNFRSGSVGNFWLAGAQLFVRSLQSAIFLFSSVCGISSQYSVIPAINTNSLVTIAAELDDGSRIVGQNEISHPSDGSGAGDDLAGSYTPASAAGWGDHGSHAGPSEPRRGTPSLRLPHSQLQWSTSAVHSGHSSRSHSSARQYPAAVHSAAFAHRRTSTMDDDDNLSVIARSAFDMDHLQDIDDGEMSWDTNRTDETSHPRQPTHPSAGNIVFDKAEDGSWRPLPSRIHRIFYLNTYGQETFPAPSSAFLTGLAESEVLVYSCGSLFTSLIPPLSLSGVGSAIAMSGRLKIKALLLNATFDRESEGLAAVDYIQAITDHLNACEGNPSLHSAPSQLAHQRKSHSFVPSDYVTHLLYLQSGEIPVDVDRLKDMQISCIPIAAARFSDDNLRQALHQVLRA